MVQEKIARLASDFATQVFAALRSASLEELAELAGPTSNERTTTSLSTSKAKSVPPSAPPARIATKGAGPKHDAKPEAKPVPKVAAKPEVEAAPAPAARTSPKIAAKAAKATPTAVRPDPKLTSAAIEFFAERGSRGATAHQLTAQLADLGFASSGDVFATLVESGAIRDAGFRRAAGKNATAPVFVAR